MLNSYGIVTALYNVIWSYIGYSNANYALSETKNPVQTLKRAAPAALILVSILYMLANVSNPCLSKIESASLTFFRLHTSQRSQKQISSARDALWLLHSSATCSVPVLSVSCPSLWRSLRSEMS
jgi:amino acid permease